MKRDRRLHLLFRLITAVLAAAFVVSAHAQTHAPVSPVAFVENRGEIRDVDGNLRPDILYWADVPGGRLLVRRDGFSWVVVANTETNSPATTRPGVRVDVDPVDPEPDLLLIAEGPIGPRRNVCRAGSSAISLPTVQRLRWKNLYPNIDLVLDVSGSQFKYDFIVHPGGRVADIRVRYRGGESVEIAPDGSIRTRTAVGDLVDHPPISFQPASDHPAPVDVERTEMCDSVGSRFGVDNGIISFDVDPYDSTRPLVIDPALSWGTYFGGSLWDYSYGSLDGIGGWNGAPRWASLRQGMAIDPSGNYILVGASFSPDFPLTPGPFQQRLHGESDAVLMSFSHDGKLRWSTYFGGSLREYATSVSIDNKGDIAVVGTTASSDLPVTPGAFQQSLAGGTGEDLFLARFDSNGGLVWSTYFGGSLVEEGTGCAFNSRGGIVVSGATESGDLPVTFNALQRKRGGRRDLFVACFTPGGGSVVWSTFLGGDRDEFGAYVTVDRRDNVILCGTSFSTDFPTTAGAAQPRFTPTSLPNSFESVLASLDLQGNLNWSTYHGGSGFDWSAGVVVDPRDYSVYLAGTTSSSDMTVSAGAMQNRLAGNSSSDLFVTRFNDRGQQLWSTYYGGSQDDYCAAVAISPAGSVVLLGSTQSRDIVRGPDRFQSFLDSLADMVILELADDGTFFWDTYFGGNGNDWGGGLVVDGAGSIVINGITSSTDLPLRNSHQGRLNTDSAQTALFPDIVVASFCNRLSPTFLPMGDLLLCDGDSLVLTAPAGYIYRWSPGGETTRSITLRGAGAVSLALTTLDGCSGESATRTVTVVPPPAAPTILPDGPTEFCEGDHVVLRGISPGVGGELRWSTGERGETITVTDDGEYSVAYIDSLGCSSMSAPRRVVVNPSPARPLITDRDTLWLCIGDPPLLLDANRDAAAYRWSTGATSRTIAAATPGTYRVRTVSPQGCESEADSVVVSSGDTIPPVVLRPSGPLVFCEGDSVSIDAPPGLGGYRWSTGDTLPTIVVRSSGSYSLSVINRHGCTAQSLLTVVEVIPPPTPVIRPQGPIVLNDGDSIELTLDRPYSLFRWSTGEVSPSITVRTSGTYSVVATDAHGCSGLSPSVDVRRPDSGHVVVTIPDHVGFPGTTVGIALLIDPRLDLRQMGVTGFSADIRFDNTLLLPLEGTPPGIVEGNDRVIHIEGGVVDGVVGPEIHRLGFLVALGRHLSTPVTLERFAWKGGRISSTVQHGEFRLDRYCAVGGARLVAIEQASALRIVRPNPASTEVVVGWTLADEGPIKLSLISVLGAENVLLQRNGSSKGDEILVLDLSEIPTGLYMLRLQTASGTVVHPLAVVK